MRSREYPKDLEAWFWFYRSNVRNYPGVHFTARSGACDVLIDCLRNWESQPLPRRTFQLPELVPADEAKISGGQSFTCFRKLRLVWSDEPREIVLIQHREETTLELVFSARNVPALCEVIADVKAGIGDTSIRVHSRRGGDDRLEKSSLTYRPCFGHLFPVP